MSDSPAPFTRTGRVWVFGDNVNTDLIMPNTAFRLPRAEQHKLAFEAVRPGWSALTRPGDIIVAGRNFGMGSGRPIDAILRACGIAGVIAESVNGLCLRTLVNGSIPAMDCAGVSRLFEEGDTCHADFATGAVENKTRAQRLTGRRLAPLLRDIVSAGGIVPMLVKEGYVEGEAFTAAST